MAAKAANTRVEWVDAAKGVGILLVIAGHVWWRGPARDAIYAFHMPLFFLLSGYMVKPQPGLTLLARQARSLVMPFIAFSLILIAVDIGVETMRGVRPIFSGFEAGMRAIVLKTETLRGPFTILWFIPCLVFARIAWNGIARCWPDPSDWRWALLVAIVMSAASFVAVRTSASPLGIMAAPGAFTLYWVGQLWKARPPGWALALFVLAPLAFVTFKFLPAVNMKAGDFGMPVLSLAGAAAISILLCLAIARLPEFAMGPLAWLGKASLVIMYVHVAFIHYLSPYFGRWILFGFALVGSVLVHLAASATRPGRIILIGER